MTRTKCSSLPIIHMFDSNSWTQFVCYMWALHIRWYMPFLMPQNLYRVMRRLSTLNIFIWVVTWRFFAHAIRTIGTILTLKTSHLFFCCCPLQARLSEAPQVATSLDVSTSSTCSDNVRARICSRTVWRQSLSVPPWRSSISYGMSAFWNVLHLHCDQLSLLLHHRTKSS